MKAFVAVVSSLVAASQGQLVIPQGYAYSGPNYVAAAPQVVAHPQVYAAPQVIAPAPVAPAIPAPLAAPSSQFQAQDEFGNLNYGYSNINSQKHEVGNAYGGVTGAYSYVDANGELQRVEYVADELGFRVKATNLPVAPDAPDAPELVAPVFEGQAPVFEGEAPVQVDDTAEVKAAKAAFFERFNEEKSREKREAQLALPYAYANGYGYPYGAVAAPAYAGLTPVVAKTPAATVKAVHAVTAPVAVAPALSYAHTPLAAPYAAVAAPYAAAIPAVAAPAPAVVNPAPVAYAAAPAAAPGIESTLTITKLNPGHATAYRVD